MIVTIIIFIIVLSLLVFVHELGHFVMAKRSGMGVHEFGFGFPPRVIGLQKIDGKWRIVGRKAEGNPQNTIYSINAIPLGGFVKIVGEDNNESDDPSSFTNKSFWARLITLAAGVLMNVLTAWVILSLGFMIGLPVAVNEISEVPKNATFSNQSILIGEVQPNSPAERDGLKESDIIRSVDGQVITEISDLQSYIKAHQGQAIAFDVQRLNEMQHIVVQAQNVAEDNQVAVGIGLGYYGTIKFGILTSLKQGAVTTVNQLRAIVTGLASVFKSKAGLQSIGGPVKIAQLTGQVAQLGLLPLLQFTAFLSLNLAILNTLPFPALDGGRMLFLIIEKLRGKPNNQNIEQYANAIGFMLLLLLMVVVTVRDVSQLQVIKSLFG